MMRAPSLLIKLRAPSLLAAARSRVRTGVGVRPSFSSFFVACHTSRLPPVTRLPVAGGEARFSLIILTSDAITASGCCPCLLPLAGALTSHWCLLVSTALTPHSHWVQ